MTTVIWVVAVVVLLGVYLSWTAGRLDRLHTRIDAGRAGLDAQLLRRASVAQELATSGVLDPASAIVLYQAAHAARQAGDEQREVAESELTQAIGAVFGEPEQLEAVRRAPGGAEAAAELAAAVRRVPMARRFHNDAVRAARAVRRHRIVRYLRLAGTAPFPMTFEMDDSVPGTLDGAAGTAPQPPSGHRDPGPSAGPRREAGPSPSPSPTRDPEPDPAPGRTPAGE